VKTIRFFLLLFPVISFAQAPELTDAADIYHEIAKLKYHGSVLYIAAHPDDENTRLISYFANEDKARTAYLSLTRGDGGQNLIGGEVGAALGLIRTQELREARKVDGGEQFFTRAVDFGYSKTPEETFSFWGKGNILRDVVWVIRKFQPDVIVTRFPTDGGGGHGHHTASAILAEEAFDLAADTTAFPEQLKFVDPWQPQRLFFNTSSWWKPELKEITESTEVYKVINAGAYNPTLGLSYTEMASMSRDNHKSQGFGSARIRGDYFEHLQQIKGSPVDGNVWEGMNRTWSDWGYSQIDEQVAAILREFNPNAPENSISKLISLYDNVAQLDFPQKGYVLEQIESIVLKCAGVYFEARAEQPQLATGSSTEVNCTFLTRRPADIRINYVGFLGGKKKYPATALNANQPFEISGEVFSSEKTSNPYWLNKPYEYIFDVPGYDVLGQPENDPQLYVRVGYTIQGHLFYSKIPVVYKWVDRVRGELYRYVHVVPDFSIEFKTKSSIFTDDKSREVFLTVKSFSTDSAEGVLSFQIPDGWKVFPASIRVRLNGFHDEKTISVKVTPPAETDITTIGVTFTKDFDDYQQTVRMIEYDHIEPQVYLTDAKMKAVRVSVENHTMRIGYIMGSGDEVPEAMRQMGYEVVDINEENFAGLNLGEFDVIVAGIRAYNTQDWLKYRHRELMNFVKRGGKYIVQYNTRGVVSDDMAPYAFEMSRERVTEEDSEVRFLAPNHPIMTTPNTLTQKDFIGWNQERGLYFASSWGEEYTPIFGWNDAGEPSRDGGLIVADYGEGHFIYTGISFFRHLPAGVPGSYRLWSNLLQF
jgi:LmbE family N-acetylglucosaminyl deacetylase